MPSVPIPVSEAAGTPPRKRFTVAEVDQLFNLGFFVGERYELIDGDLLVKHGQSPEHAFALHRTWVLLGRLFPVERVLNQMPVQAAGDDAEYSLPEPDLGLLLECKPEYARRHPRGNDLAFAIEVSDNTVAFDRSRKAAMYAHAGIPEFWVLDLMSRTLIAHGDPDGVKYRLVQQYDAGETIQFPGRSESIQISALLPPA